jgi:cysteine desulfurase
MSVYLDSNSGMPVRPEVVRAMLPYLTDHYGNASSIHSMGNEPKRALDRARTQVSSLIGAGPEEIVFTSGATESVNLAFRGTMAYAPEGRRSLLVSVVDHRTATATAEALHKDGFGLTVLPVDGEGSMKLDALETALSEGVHLVSVPFASQEVGTIQPVKRIIEISHAAGALVHIDLTRSAFQIKTDIKNLGADMATLSSNDLLGPKGVGALYIRRGVKVKPQLAGGGHERGLRSGSENIPGIVGMGLASTLAMERMAEESARMTDLRDRLISGLLRIPDTHLNGSRTNRLPNNVNVRFDYIEGESILLMMDLNGIQTASGSACSSKTLEPSATLMAMGLKHEQAHGSIQMTMNPFTTVDDVDQVISVMPMIVENLRMMSPLYVDR